MQKLLLSLLIFFLLNAALKAQLVQPQREEDSTVSLQQLPSKYPDHVSSKASKLEEQLNKKTGKALQQMIKEEAKLKRKLQKIDSLAASSIFANAENRYKELEQRLRNTSLQQYLPRLDTLSTSIKFLQQNPQLLSTASEIKEKLKDAMTRVKGMEGQFQKAEELKRFLKERKELLRGQLEKFGLTKELKKLNKQVYYYAQQVNEYKEILNDPKKIEKKALELLAKTKFFQDFFRKNSMLASLFRMPGDPNDPAAQASLAGLQTRAMVQQGLIDQFGAAALSPSGAVGSGLQNAQSQLSQLKDKVMKFGGSSSDDILPEGFKPNDQKTKSFFQRLEYGTNIQSQKATNFFPVTSDLGLSLGYKLNDKSVIGIGASYKMGWGKGWNNINITHQGIGFRSFVDIKLKGSLWISGGYEQNYKSAFKDFSQLKDKSAWQESGLIGISKVVSLKTKVFKKTKLQLLWDFMSYEQVPRTQPVVFRIGYNF